MQLTPETAKEFAIKELEKIADKEDREFSITYTGHVVKAALILAEGKDIDKNILEIAGWLHDIGKSIQEKEHEKYSVKILEENGVELNEKMRDCILNHGSLKNPTTEEGKIMQIADKTCILNPEFLELLMKYNKGPIREGDLNFTKKMTTFAADLLKKLK